MLLYVCHFCIYLFQVKCWMYFHCETATCCLWMIGQTGIRHKYFSPMNEHSIENLNSGFKSELFFSACPCTV